MGSRRPIPLLCAAAMLIAACMQEAKVDVARQGQAITVAVTRHGAEKPPCVDSVVISPAGTDVAAIAPVWELSTADRSRCRSSFTYGQVPAGYAQSGAAPALLVGSRYLVEVSGPGLLGGREVTIRAENGTMAD